MTRDKDDYIQNLFKRVEEENKKSVKFFEQKIGQKIEIGGKKV